MTRLLACALMGALALTAVPAVAKGKSKGPPKIAHPHLSMLKLRLAKFLPPGQDKKRLGDVDPLYTVLADGTILRHKTIDFLVREFGPLACKHSGMEPIGGMMETIPPIDSPDSAQVAADRLTVIQKKAIGWDVADREKRLAMAKMIGELRNIAKRAAEEEPTEGLSRKQLYTQDSFEADKLGDGILRIFRTTMDAGLDSEEHGLGEIFEAHLRSLIDYARPPNAPKAKPSKKKK